MGTSSRSSLKLRHEARRWWRDNVSRKGLPKTLATSLALTWTFLRDSTPSRRRQRYGDMDYDWDFRVDTTSATVGWRERLLGEFHSPYQPTDPASFHEMMGRLEIEFARFTFIDLGSGKGRTLLMASEYPFRRILGVELLPELNRIALENIQKFRGAEQRCFSVDSRCGDARSFQFPAEPTVLYLFNPLPEAGLVEVIGHLESSLREHLREAYVIYHNPLLRHILDASPALRQVGGTAQYLLYASDKIDSLPHKA